MQIREKLLIAIEEIGKTTNLEEAHKIVRELSLFSLEKGRFHIEGLVYQTFISRLFSHDILRDRSVLKIIKRTVEERNFQPRSYAITYDLTTLFDDADSQAHQTLKELLTEISNNKNVSIRDSDKQRQLTQELRRYSNREKPFIHLHEIMLYDAVQILILLPPVRSNEYEMRSTSYNCVHSGSAREQLENQLSEAKKLIEKLEGESIIYLAIRVQPQGYVVSIR